MKFFRLDLLTLLISLFILSGCKNQDGIGLSVSSSQTLNGNLIDSATIKVNTVPEDSVVTEGLAKTPLGYFVDPVFGSTTSNIAAGLDLPGHSAYSLPSGTIVIDSVRLLLRYADGFYGDSLASKYKVNVYQLKEGFSSTVSYYNNKAWNFDNTNLLGTKLFSPRPKTGYYITDIVTGAKDTLIKVKPILRIPINNSFINDILFNTTSTQLASLKLFRDAVKGLYLTVDKTQSTGPGGTMMFQLDSSSVAIYIRTTSGTTVDTSLVTMPLTSSMHAAQITHTYSAAINTELSNTTTSRNTVYMQGLAGLRAKISFPYLKNIITSLGTDVVINRAELVITPSPGTTVPYQAQPKLTMYQLDIANQRTYLQDAYQSDRRYLSLAVFGGYYTSNRDYHFVITGYVQDLMRGKTIDHGTYIAPVDTTNTTTVDIAATPQTAGRVMVVGTDKTSAYRMKLNLIYTKVNQ